MRKPRKLKKQIKKAVLIYDVCSLPRGKTVKDIHKEFNDYGIVLWASKAHANTNGLDAKFPPTIVGKKSKLKIIDTSGRKD